MSEIAAEPSRIAECVQRLTAELSDAVHLPGSRGYEVSLGRVFFPDASRRHPPVVVTPRSVHDVAITMRTATETGAQVAVRGGGLSSNCVADGAMMIDLSVHLGTARPDGELVVVGGGATVGVLPERTQVPLGWLYVVCGAIALVLLSWATAARRQPA
jgi:hypothetical protein